MDYLSLQTLESVIRNQNFERAAKELTITQSAVSQRINQLEAEYGQRLLVRELPYKATELGEKLLSHFRKVMSLEQELKLEPQSQGDDKTSIKIAMNVDTVDIWFKKIFESRELAKLINLEITVDDEKYTINYLKSGQVDVCIGTNKTPVSNHECIHLGTMTYVLVASPEFKKTFAPKGMKSLDMNKTPAIIFNNQDDLHTEYLKQHFGFVGAYPKSSIPSIPGSKAALISGFGYSLQPLMDIQKELKSKVMVLLDEGRSYKRELYLHYWTYQTPALKKLISAIQSASRHLV